MRGYKGKSKYVGEILKGFKIIEYIPAKNGSNPKLKGVCINCGREIVRAKSGFLQEHSRICCVCQEKYSHHNQSYTRLYTTYQNMKKRCFNPNNKYWYLYGGKGVTVCDEWLGKYGFVNFREWATPREQNFNTSRTIFATIGGVTKPLMKWCEEYGIGYQCVRARLRRGWGMEMAITTPKKQ